MDLDKLEQALTGKDLTAADWVAALAVLVIGTAVAILVGRMARAHYGRPGRQADQVAKLIAGLARWLIQILAIAWALSIIGLGIGWVTITVAVLLLAFTVGARPLVENVAASIVLVSRPAFEIGDEIEIEGYRGEIIEITNRSTVLRLRDGRRLHIPNAEVLRQNVIVYTTEWARRSSLDVTIDHGVEVDEAEQVILSALASLDAVAADPPPSVRAREFTEGVRLSARFWHGPSMSDGNRALDAAVRVVKQRLGAAGIELAVPQVELRSAGDRPDVGSG